MPPSESQAPHQTSGAHRPETPRSQPSPEIETTARDRFLDGLLTELLALPDGERSALLDERCGDDAFLRSGALELLAAAENDTRWLESERHGIDRLLGTLLEASGGDRGEPGRRLGRYRLVEPIGRGGMGTVWAAERADGLFEQDVAIKILELTASPAARRRFTREARILARLEHPGIARLLDAGHGPDQAPYLVMELVRGIPLDQFVRERSTTTTGRLALFRQVCRAIAFAHRRLVLHRDLKPANILVDEGGRVRVLDFGIGALLEELGDDDGPGGGPVTRAYTPGWGSPEQIRGDSVGIASDVFQLGLLLDVLLVGPEGTAEERAARPASRRLAERRDADPALVRRLRGGLDAVIARCLVEDPEQRYESAGLLDREIEAEMTGEPLQALRHRRGHRLQRVLRRHWRPLAAGVLTLLLVGLTVVGYTLRLRVERDRTRSALEEARQSRDEAEEVTRFLVDSFRTGTAVPEDDPLTVRELLGRTSRRLDREITDRPLLEARLAEELGLVQYQVGDTESGHALLLRSLALRRRELEPEHPDIASSLTSLARYEVAMGRPEEAEPLLVEALDIARAGGDRRILGYVAGNLGWLMLERNRFADAETAFREALATWRPMPPRDVDVISVYNGLGRVLDRRARYDESAQVLEEGLAVAETIGLENSQQIADLLINLSMARRRRGDLEGALRLRQRALSLAESRYGVDSPRLSSFLRNLADLHDRMDRPERAGELLQRAVTVLEGDRDRRRGNEDVLVLDALARNLRGRGRLDSATAALERALAIAVEIDAPASNRAWLEIGRGDLQLARNRPADALRAYRSATGMHREVLEPGHPWLSWSLHGEAQSLLRLGRDADACGPALEALAIRRDHMDANRSERMATEELVRQLASADVCGAGS